MSVDLRALNTNVSEIRKESFCRLCRCGSLHSGSFIHSGGENVSAVPPEQQHTSDSPFSEKHHAALPLEQQTTSNTVFSKECHTALPAEKINIVGSSDVVCHENEKGYTSQEEYSTRELQASEDSENSTIEPGTSQTVVQDHDTHWQSINCEDLPAVAPGMEPLHDTIKEERRDDTPEDSTLGQESHYLNMRKVSSVKEEEWHGSLEDCDGDENIAKVVHEYQSGVSTSESMETEEAVAGTSLGIQHSAALVPGENEAFQTSEKEPYLPPEMYCQIAFPRRHPGRNRTKAEMPLVCPTCSLPFAAISELTVHVLGHSTNKQCSICQKILPSLPSLRNHIYYHFRQRKHQCEFCGKRFIQKIHLKDHLRLHTNEKPYQCPV